MLKNKKFGFVWIFICLSLNGYGAVFPNGANVTPYTKNDGGTDNNTAPSTNASNIAYANSSTLNNSSSIDNLVVGATFTVNSSAIFNNLFGGTFINNGILGIDGIVNNAGTLDNFLALVLTSGGILNNSGTLTNNLDLQIKSGCVLNNNSGGMLTIASVLTNSGTLNSSGVLSNTGTLTNNGGLNNNSGGFLTNTGMLSNILGMTNRNGATLTNNNLIQNTGTLTNAGVLNNMGTLSNFGSLNINVGGTLNNAGALDNNTGDILYNAGILNNNGAGILTNDGSLTNDTGGMLSNNSMFTNNAVGTVQSSGTFENNGATLNNAGAFNSSGTLNNTGTVNNNSGGSFTNDGNLFNLSGAIENKSGATLTSNNFFQNNDILTNNGVLNNNNNLNNDGTGTFNNMGTINNTGGLNIISGSTFNQSGILNLNSGILFLGQTHALEINDNVTIGTVQVTLEEGAALNVDNRTGNITFQQPIINSGSVGDTGGFTQNSDVTTVLVGDNTFSGVTNVNMGILYVNGPSIGSPGTLITPVNVTNATFGGTNFTRVKFDPGITDSGNLHLNANSIVAPGGDALYGQLTVDGDVNFSHTTAMFDLEVDSVSNTDKIVAGGTANLNGLLQIDAAVGNFIAGQRITVVEAGSIDGTFSTVTVPMLLNGDPLFLVEYTPTTVDLVVQEDDLFSTTTVSLGNARSVLDYIVAQVPIDPNSDFGFVVESLGLLTDKELKKALNLMHPAALGNFGFMNIATNSQIMQMMSSKIKSKLQAVSRTEPISYLEPTLTAAVGDRPFYPGAPVRRGCSRDLNDHHDVWVQPFGSWNTQSRKGELRGANYETAGVMAGYDYLFEHFYVGAALGYAYTNFRWHGTAGKGHIDQVYGGLYGSYFMKFFSATLATMVGGNFYDVNRNIRYDAVGHPGAILDRTAHSHNTGIQWTNHLGLIGDFSPFDVFLQIFANLDHFYLHDGSFNESGAQSLNLKVGSKTSNALRSELGFSSSYTFQVKHGCWTPYAQLSWVNKTLLSSSSYRSGFRGQVRTFSVNTTSKGTNQVSPGVGVEFANKSGFSILLNARAELNGKMKSYFADMRFDYVF